MTDPDPTNGIVIVPNSVSGGKTYHTRVCSHYPGKPKPRVLGQLPDGYQPCGFCVERVEYANGASDIECPFCGVSEKMSDHLPCEASP